MSASENTQFTEQVFTPLINLHPQVRVNRERLMVPSLNAIATLLHTLKQCLAAEPEVVAGPPGGASLTEQLLQVSHIVTVLKLVQ